MKERQISFCTFHIYLAVLTQNKPRSCSLASDLRRFYARVYGLYCKDAKYREGKGHTALERVCKSGSVSRASAPGRKGKHVGKQERVRDVSRPLG